MTATNDPFNDALPTGERKRQAVRKMFDDIAPRYDLVNRVMTFGLDVRWRNLALRRLALPPRSLVADIACGTGDFCRLLEQAGHRPIGIDLSLGMLRKARTSAPLLQADATALPFADGALDGLTCGFALRNFVDLQSFFAEAARVLHTGGRVVLLDAYAPTAPVVRSVHKFYFRGVVPRIGGLLSNRAAYTYLPKSLGYLPPIPTLLSWLEEAGFQAVQRTTLTFGTAHLITATRR